MNALGGNLPGFDSTAGGNVSLGNIAAHLGTSSAAALANASLRSLITGSDFGDTLIAALPDVIGQTIGSLVASGVASAAKAAKARDAEEGGGGGGTYNRNPLPAKFGGGRGLLSALIDPDTHATPSSSRYGNAIASGNPILGKYPWDGSEKQQNDWILANGISRSMSRTLIESEIKSNPNNAYLRRLKSEFYPEQAHTNKPRAQATGGHSAGSSRPLTVNRHYNALDSETIVVTGNRLTVPDLDTSPMKIDLDALDVPSLIYTFDTSAGSGLRINNYSDGVQNFISQSAMMAAGRVTIASNPPSAYEQNTAAVNYRMREIMTTPYNTGLGMPTGDRFEYNYLVNKGTLADLQFGTGLNNLGSMYDGFAAGFAVRPRTSFDVVRVGKVHGNSALSPRPTYLYKLYQTDGTFLKNGITQNFDTRYSRAFMKDKYFERITSGARADMIRLERQATISNPGPLNHEPWAVKARAESGQ
jgi:hypothetical protein